ncbi:MAG: GyrI-like domain-containing protein [bacterium]
MKKLDLKKTLVWYSAKPGIFQTVSVLPCQYLMVDGKGDPNTSKEYVAAIEALYPLAYTLKFMAKKELEKDYGVLPLEGLWWMEDMSRFTAEDKTDWLWTAMIMQPDFITREMFDRAVDLVAAKKKPEALAKTRLETYDEGRSAQTLYVGPYSDEGPTIQALHAYIKEQGGALDGTNKHHHEIYLGDPRRTKPEKLKTIIRQPY